MTRTVGVHQRFYAKVVEVPSGCHEWCAGKLGGGYGSFWLNGKTQASHRVAWVLANGPIPSGLDVLHSCDNPPCVRIDHLFLGTPQDNALDCAKKGRSRFQRYPPKGEANPQSKLSDNDVQEIRRLHGTVGQDALASLFDINQSTISRIVNKKRRYTDE